MYLTHDVQTTLRTANLHQADVRAAFPRGRRLRTWWPSRRVEPTTAPTRPVVMPTAPPRHGTPAAA